MIEPDIMKTRSRYRGKKDTIIYNDEGDTAKKGYIKH